MKKIKVLLIDDHAIMRMGLASLLGTQKDLEVVGDADNGKTGINKALKLRPDVVIVDLLMPGMDGTETTRRLREQLPESHVMILTSFGTADGIAHALSAGACGAIMKNAKLPELVSAIRKVALGHRAVSDEIEQMMTDNPPVPELSSRQSEILAFVIQGLSNAEIADRLAISAPMVRDHLKAIFAKLGAANRAEAVAIALRKHLLKT